MPIQQNDVIDYQEVIRKYPWLVKRGQDCILSPDSDGLLCGLFMSHILGWNIRGFYDGKILLLEKGFSASDCVFLDMEVFRKEVRSVGQHMVLYNIDELPPNWANFDNCASINNIRGYDMKHNFPQKYPLGTIHFLLSVVSTKKKIAIPTSAVCPLLYTDGTFKNLFNYPDNCLSWLSFLQAQDPRNPLHSIFFNDHYSISSLMNALKELFGELRLLADGKRGGDKIKFSDTKGKIVNFDEDSGSLETATLARTAQFLQLLSKKTGWKYVEKYWCWKNLSTYIFTKGVEKPSKRRYNTLMSKNPLSLAITSGLTLEYTLDSAGLLES